MTYTVDGFTFTPHAHFTHSPRILLAAVVTIWLRLPMSLEVVVDYVAGFSVGLFVFQAFCMKPSLNGSCWSTVKGTLFAETISMNAVMAGMIPVMVILMTLDTRWP